MSSKRPTSFIWLPGINIPEWSPLSWLNAFVSQTHTIPTLLEAYRTVRSGSRCEMNGELALKARPVLYFFSQELGHITAINESFSRKEKCKEKLSFSRVLCVLKVVKRKMVLNCRVLGVKESDSTSQGVPLKISCSFFGLLYSYPSTISRKAFSSFSKSHTFHWQKSFVMWGRVKNWGGSTKYRPCFISKVPHIIMCSNENWINFAIKIILKYWSDSMLWLKLNLGVFFLTKSWNLLISKVIPGKNWERKFMPFAPDVSLYFFWALFMCEQKMGAWLRFFKGGEKRGFALQSV